MRRPIAALIALLSLAACTSGGSASAGFRPSFSSAACPPDVEAVLLVTHSCGYLTVLADRTRPDGPKLRIFVLRMDPPKGVTPSPDPVLLMGADVGDQLGYGGVASTPQRLHRVVYVEDPRGTGHSGPSLACPEVARVSTSGQPSTADFVKAVSACGDRLARQGVNPADFTPASVAADAVDLRVALGIGRWNLGSYGSTSRTALEVARIDAPHVRAVWLDSPEFAAVSPAAWVVPGTDAALERLFSACAHDRGCARAYPDLRALWSRAVSGFTPTTISARDTTTGAAERVRVDAAGFIRAVRLTLAGNDQWVSNIARLPGEIAAAARGRVDVRLATLLASDDAMCAGFRANCRTSHFFLGSALSAICPDRGAPGRVDPLGVGVAYSPDPYTAACAAWPVADPTPTTPPAVPVLVLVGAFDPLTSAGLAERNLRGDARHRVVTFPDGTHNLVGFDPCAIAIRNAWVDAPTVEPDTSCVSQAPMHFTIRQGS